MKRLHRIAWLVVGWAVGSVVTGNEPGRLDTLFAPEGSIGGRWVTHLLIQKDGKILALDAGHRNSDPKEYIRRLHSDGSEDPSFRRPKFLWAEFGPPPVSALALMDERILIGGHFTNINDTAVRGLARVNGDGTLDKSFQTSAQFRTHSSDGSFQINALAVQADGKILVGGRFHTVNGRPQVHLARLHADGSFDESFRSVISQVGASQVSAVLIEPSGSIVVAGSFSVDRSPSGGIARLKPDGEWDSSFAPRISYLFGPINLALDGDRILLLSDDQPSPRLRRLLSDGRFDPSFNIGLGPNERLRDVKVQTDGKILVAGDFTSFDGQPRKHVARLHPDGRLDATFDTSMGPDAWVFATALDGKGGVLIGGLFGRVEQSLRPGLARLFGNDPAPRAPSIRRQPKPVSVEVGDNAHFEVSADGFPLSYHWLANGRFVAGETNSVLRLFNTEQVQAGSYRVVVSNALGQAISDPVRLELLARSITTNLVRNPSFEETVSSTSPPNFPIFNAQGWAASHSTVLLRYPVDVPLNLEGSQMALAGSNYVGLANQTFSLWPSGSVYVGGSLTGQLTQATSPGGRYSVEAWFSKAENSHSPEVGVELLLGDGRGAILSLGAAPIRDTEGWERYHRTVIVSRPYDRIIVRGAKTPLQGDRRGYLYLDKISLAPVAPTAPAFAPVPPHEINPRDALVITNRVTDTDVTDAALVYSLVADPPPGIAIDPMSGTIRWSPELPEAGGTFQVLVKASYNGSDTLTSTNVVAIRVAEAIQLTIGQARLRAGERGSVPLDLSVFAPVGVGLDSLRFRLQFPARRLAEITLTSLHPDLGECSVTRLDETQAMVHCTARPGRTLASHVKLAELGFQTESEQRSGFFSFQITEVLGIANNGRQVTWSLSRGGRIGIVGQEALLESWPSENAIGFRLYGPMGKRYRLETTSDLSGPAVWQPLRDVVLTNFFYQISGFETNRPALFLRARELP